MGCGARARRQPTWGRNAEPEPEPAWGVVDAVGWPAGELDVWARKGWTERLDRRETAAGQMHVGIPRGLS